MVDSSWRRTMNRLPPRSFFEPKMRHIISELVFWADFVEVLEQILGFLLSSHEAVKPTASEK